MSENHPAKEIRRYKRTVDARLHLLIKAVNAGKQTEKKGDLSRKSGQLPQTQQTVYEHYYLICRHYRVFSEQMQALRFRRSAEDVSVAADLALAREFSKAETLTADFAEDFLIRAGEKLPLSESDLLLFSAFLHGEALIKIQALWSDAAAHPENDGKNQREAERLFSLFYFLEKISFFDWREKILCGEKFLMRDKIYREMSEESRSVYREKIAKTAQETGRKFEETARILIEKAEKEGISLCFLLENEPKKLKKVCFFGIKTLIFLSILLPFFVVCRNIGLILLALIPAWCAADIFLSPITAKLLKDRPMLRLKPGSTLLSEKKCAVVVPTLLTAETAASFPEKLEALYLQNRTANASFGMLFDLPECAEKQDKTDAPLIRRVEERTAALNEKYGDRFYAAVRERSFSRTQQSYIGADRKRGAIEALVGAMCGMETADLCFFGPKPQGEYLLTLDADTEPELDAVNTLMRIALHPANVPLIGKDGRVKRGYGVLSPALIHHPLSGFSTAFGRLLLALDVTRAYPCTHQNVYWDLFESGSFCGKGLIHVHTYAQILSGKMKEDRILSHDLLEGAALRTGYVSDVSFREAQPDTVLSFLKREHRWIRGDWQLLSVWNAITLPWIDRMKMAENLIRSLSAPTSVALIFCGAFFAGLIPWYCLFAAILPIVASPYLQTLTQLLTGQTLDRRVQYASRLLPAFEANVINSLLLLLALPCRAFIDADAVIRALYRQFISGRKLLEWSVFEPVSEREECLRYYISFWVPTAFCAASSIYFAIRASFVCLLFWLWCLAPLCFTILSIATGNKTKGLTREQKQTVRHWAEDIWKYAKEHLNADENWLLPDNEQTAPDTGTAHRTSPTNIGFSLLLCLSARDLGFITTPELCEMLSGILGTVERLERKKGHLYNWYDTRTGKPLEPRYVSTVDSGNLCVCLSVLYEGLRDYEKESEQIGELRARAKNSERLPDFSFLFDEKCGLLAIGCSENAGVGENNYDMLMSESRLTYYYLCATGQIPPRGFQKLAAPYLYEDGKFGIASWNGSVFEYFMPRLFLPAKEGTEAYEALNFAFCAGRKKAGELPFGVSESCYYAFDETLCYRYSGHGIGMLGEKDGLDEEYVISPYASFLTLSAYPQASFRNLEKIREAGGYGKYGFIEAIDYTRRRTGGGPAHVSTFMAHHLGMSMVGCVNALTDELFVKRFFGQPMMRAYSSLIDNGSPRRVWIPEKKKTDFPAKRMPDSVPIEEKGSITCPKTALLCGGEYTEVLTETGVGFGLWRGKCVTRHRRDILASPKGIFCAFVSEDGVLPLTFAPDYTDKALREAQYRDGRFYFSARRGRIGAEMTAAPVLNGSRRTITFQNYGKKPISGEMIVYFEPVLTEEKAERAHPAYAGLSVEAEFSEKEEAVLFTKRTRKKEDTMWLSGKVSGEGVSYETDASALFCYPEKTDFKAIAQATFTGAKKDCIQPCFAAKVHLNIAPGESVTREFRLGVGADKTEAMAALKAEEMTAVPAAGPETLERSILPALLFSDGGFSAVAEPQKCGCEYLWEQGISGDFPYISAEVEREEDVACVRPLLDAFLSLRKKGIKAEFVCLYKEDGRYERPLYDALSAILRVCGCESLLSQKGGIHLCGVRNEEQRKMLKAMAAFPMAEDTGKGQEKPLPKIQMMPAAEAGLKPECPVCGGGFVKDGFVINDPSPFPGRPCWSNVLAGKRMGCVLSDGDLGFSYFENASLYRLTPWENDPMRPEQGERLLIRMGAKIYDPIRAATCLHGINRSEYFSALPTLGVHAQIDIGDNRKRIIVEFVNRTDKPISLGVMYGICPLLGAVGGRGLYDISRHSGGYYLRNRYEKEFSQVTAYLYCSAATYFLRDRGAFLRGDFGGEERNGLFAAVGGEIRLKGGERKSIAFVLGCEATSGAAFAAVSGLLSGEEKENEQENLRPLLIDTPDRALNEFVNHFLYAQILLSRLRAKSGYYQSSGAFGFRDQLQDCMALKSVAPRKLRRQIIRSCLHQFEAGDVMHWWHHFPGKYHPDKGVRTRCSDDMLWLVLAVCEYEQIEPICELALPYLSAEELKTEERERYFSPGYTDYKESVYLHALRAIKRALKTGQHGLLLIGTGDWNDGFSAVGEEGRGESVWLTMFAVAVLEKFLPLAEKYDGSETAEKLMEWRNRLIFAVEQHGWDGKWYRRAYFDDGTPLGSVNNEECRIDLMPQIFASLCGALDVERVKRAWESMEQYLLDEQHALLSLFTPPISAPKRDPGYIKEYTAGVRENGGQYSHGAAFAAWAHYRAGNAEGGYRYLTLLNPVNSALAGRMREYKKEPYVLCGDVYTAKHHIGMGGWSWYTGTAGWFFRCVIEGMLGVRRKGDAVSFIPLIPAGWDGLKAEICVEGTRLLVEYRRGERIGMLVDGKDADEVKLDGKKHEIVVLFC